MVKPLCNLLYNLSDSSSKWLVKNVKIEFTPKREINELKNLDHNIFIILSMYIMCIFLISSNIYDRTFKVPLFLIYTRVVVTFVQISFITLPYI